VILDSLRVDPGELATRTGWTVKPQGACKGDVCVPVPTARQADGTLDASVVSERLGMPLVADGIPSRFNLLSMWLAFAHSRSHCSSFDLSAPLLSAALEKNSFFPCGLVVSLGIIGAFTPDFLMIALWFGKDNWRVHRTAAVAACRRFVHRRAPSRADHAPAGSWRESATCRKTPEARICAARQAALRFYGPLGPGGGSL